MPGELPEPLNTETEVETDFSFSQDLEKQTLLVRSLYYLLLAIMAIPLGAVMLLGAIGAMAPIVLSTVLGGLGGVGLGALFMGAAALTFVGGLAIIGMQQWLAYKHESQGARFHASGEWSEVDKLLDSEEDLDHQRTSVVELSTNQKSRPAPAKTEAYSPDLDILKSAGKFGKEVNKIVKDYFPNFPNLSAARLGDRKDACVNIAVKLSEELGKPDFGAKRTFPFRESNKGEKVAALSACLRIMEAIDPRKDDQTKENYADLRICISTPKPPGIEIQQLIMDKFMDPTAYNIGPEPDLGREDHHSSPSERKM